MIINNHHHIYTSPILIRLASTRPFLSNTLTTNCSILPLNPHPIFIQSQGMKSDRDGLPRSDRTDLDKTSEVFKSGHRRWQGRQGPQNPLPCPGDRSVVDRAPQAFDLRQTHYSPSGEAPGYVCIKLSQLFKMRRNKGHVATSPWIQKVIIHCNGNIIHGVQMPWQQQFRHAHAEDQEVSPVRSRDRAVLHRYQSTMR